MSGPSLEPIPQVVELHDERGGDAPLRLSGNEHRVMFRFFVPVKPERRYQADLEGGQRADLKCSDDGRCAVVCLCDGLSAGRNELVVTETDVQGNRVYSRFSFPFNI